MTKEMKLDLGVPEQHALVGGVSVRVRDDLGLSMDPALYAKKTCKQCYGRGVYRLRLKDKTESRACLCTVKGYDRARAQLLETAGRVSKFSHMVAAMGQLGGGA